MIYLKHLLQDKYIASVAPTSRFGVKKVSQAIHFQKTKCMVEYGPATGVFSNFFLKHLPSDATLILIETNDTFVQILNETFDDPRVHIVKESAEHVVDIVHSRTDIPVDYIVSGIPFSLMSEEVRKEIIHNTYQILREGGKFLAYQTFFQADAHLKIHLEHSFQHVHDRFEMRNIPPIRIYEAIK